MYSNVVTAIDKILRSYYVSTLVCWSFLLLWGSGDGDDGCWGEAPLLSCGMLYLVRCSGGTLFVGGMSWLFWICCISVIL